MTSPVAIRCLIVDDEEPARELLRAFLAEWPEVEIAGEAGDGPAAVAAIRALEPDLVFLDVKMPGMSGIDVVAALEAPLPLVVFVTAYDDYAVKAFEVSAFDYLLKPFEAGRLGTTMRRVLSRVGETGVRPVDVARLLRALDRAPRPPAQLVVKSEGRHLFLDQAQIEWLEAVGKHVRLHLVTPPEGGTLEVREPLQGLADRLDPADFLRVHRSAIVNRRHIREIQPWFKGDFVVVLRRGGKVVTGRTYRSVIQELVAR